MPSEDGRGRLFGSVWRGTANVFGGCSGIRVKKYTKTV